MVEAIINEIHQRHQELNHPQLTSIYFGGGTPSLLDEKEIESILDTLSTYYSWDENAEITLEANPDDLTKPKLLELKRSSINRLSIGIQSFDEADLKYMNRAHSAEEAKNCIDQALDFGFENLTADLIYGSPTTSDETWQSNIEKMLSYNLPHISAYCLTVEEGTPGNHAIHNTNYWKGTHYLGLGPAAHSYDGERKRRWNVAHNAQYIKAINTRTSYSEQELLTKSDRYNEYILTSLRTMWGIDITFLNDTFPKFWDAQKDTLEALQEKKMVTLEDNKLRLTQEGKFLADNISMQLFVDDGDTSD